MPPAFHLILYPCFDGLYGVFRKLQACRIPDVPQNPPCNFGIPTDCPGHFFSLLLRAPPCLDVLLDPNRKPPPAPRGDDSDSDRSESSDDDGGHALTRERFAQTHTSWCAEHFAAPPLQHLRRSHTPPSITPFHSCACAQLACAQVQGVSRGTYPRTTRRKRHSMTRRKSSHRPSKPSQQPYGSTRSRLYIGLSLAAMPTSLPQPFLHHHSPTTTSFTNTKEPVPQH